MVIAARSGKLEEAIAHHRRGDLKRARHLYEEVLRQTPDHFEALRLLGLATIQGGQAEKAIRLFRKALAIAPDSAVTNSDLGAALASIERYDEALARYDRALDLNPDHAETRYRRGNCLLALERFEEAVASYDMALALSPNDVETLQNRGTALSELGDLDAALGSFSRATQIAPHHPIAHYNVATALKELKRHDEAVARYSRAIALRPDYAEAHFGRANVLRDQRRFDAALADYDRTIALVPDHASAHINRAGMLLDLKRFDAARPSYEAAIRLHPDSNAAKMALSNLKASICDWSELDRRLVLLERWVRTDHDPAPPGYLTGICESPALLHAAARSFVARCYPETALPTGLATTAAAQDRIRVGYFSADFHDHATTRLMAELFELQDRDRFDYVAFSFGPPIDDAMRQRLRPCFNDFIEVGGTSDRGIAELARGLGIDIAVDLKGHTVDSRLGCFAHRMAPIQVNYLGFPGTIGADYIDYIIADQILITAADRAHYSEKVVYLPDSYQPNDRKRPISDAFLSRAEAGLPPDGFVFCCFNNNYKILPATFDAWARILAAVPGSVLWLLEDNPLAAGNLRAEAMKRGLDPARLIFAPRLPLADHLARHRRADLFLDTLPWNAHTTASDALWAGLPLLTCLGTTFSGRVAASLLRAIGLSELIVSSLDAYEDLAIALARDPDRLCRIREKLAAQRLTAPLFDTPRYVQHLEAAYVAMVERHRAGLPPDHLFISPTEGP
jgi:predicted O-linked N-acetylglucosamine transferase (SPINDLY family)